jgi:ABC-type amino acid transport system permease subunit
MLCRGGNPLANALTRFCTWLVQGLPAVVLLMVLYYIVFSQAAVSGAAVSVIGFTLVFAAAMYGMLKMGVGAVDKGQAEAARCLGCSERQTMTKIILPQAVRNILPALGNEFIMILKETSLASTFFLGDLMTSYLKVKGATYLGFETLIIVGIIYFLLTFPLSKLVAHFEKKMSTEQNYKKRNRKKVH